MPITTAELTTVHTVCIWVPLLSLSLKFPVKFVRRRPAFCYVRMFSTIRRFLEDLH